MVIFKLSMAEVAVNWKSVCDKISYATMKRPLEYQYYEPRLVAVSKLQSAEAIVAAYEVGQRHFGENYVKELKKKASDPLILERCKEIQWHFIGHLQTNKINKLLNIPNLYIIETVSSDELANILNMLWPVLNRHKARHNLNIDANAKLNVMVQVNTSQEKEKNGCDIAQVSTLVKYVVQNCPNLKFIGLMTIGKFGYDLANGPNPDFLCLISCREKVCYELGIDIKDIELSMGMSNDYEQAIELGSTNVRVGSAIFGDRPQKSDKM